MLIGKNRFIRRRVVIGLLFAASLTLLTLSFREGSTGVIGGIQRGALSVTAPFSAATTRVTRPFVDAWNWAGGLIDARSENERLKQQLERANAANLALQQLQADIEKYRLLDRFTNSSKLASQYGFVGATVIQQVPNAYNQTITLSVGSVDGVALNDPVVAPAGDSTLFAGLIGHVSSVTSNACTVRLILDPQTAVSARIVNSTVRGVAEPSSGSTGVLSLLMVGQDKSVHAGQVVVTSGIHANSRGLQALLPAGIPIGQVTSVSQSDNSYPNKTIQVTPFVDFQSIDKVLVLKVQQP
jgi:rod shape-determining protein MreC